jgi:hypothetical protein
MSEPPPETEPVRIPLELNLNAIVEPTQRAVVLCSELVDFVGAAIGASDLSKKPLNEGLQYRFTSPPISADDRRSLYEGWLYSKTFQDIMRGLKGSLEQAYLAINLLSRTHKVASGSTIDAFLAPLIKEAATLHFGPLLERVNERLPEPLPFVEAYQSLQRARNCLEHRNGIVGDIDAPAGGLMILSFPRLKTFYMREGEEIELEPGHTVDAQDGKDEVQILVKIELKQLRFSKGQRLKIEAKDFNEMAFACNYFAERLAKQVSAVKPTAAEI